MTELEQLIKDIHELNRCLTDFEYFKTNYCTISGDESTITWDVPFLMSTQPLSERRRHGTYLPVPASHYKP